MLRTWMGLALVGLLTACPAEVDDSDVDTDAGTDTDTDSDTDWDTENLRPNVQEGQPPNADGQVPESEDQTRAPQPEEASDVNREVFAQGLGIPWGLAELPDGTWLVTERSGNLRLVATDGTVGAPIRGVPSVLAQGQGGLLDVAVSPNFEADRAVFLTFSEAREGGRLAAAVGRATLSADGTALERLQTIYQQQPAWNGGRHFGSRLAFAPDGNLFVTFGDRGSAFTDAQDPNNAIGAVIRIRPDGSAPSDNPFVGGGGAAEIWSYGHRNIQSATIGADGALWTVEHGPQGGDELNRPEAGVNHGWPIITYGEDYGGSPVGDGITAQEGMAQPVYFWDPVIAPSGMATYQGELFSEWDGDLLIGGLRAAALVRLKLRNGRVYTEEWIDMRIRVRSVAVASDGSVMVGTDAGEIVRLTPGG